MQILVQKVASLSKYIVLKLKFLIKIQNYKYRLTKDINIINKLYYLSSKDFENNILYKIFNFYIIYKISTKDFQICLQVVNRINIT